MKDKKNKAKFNIFQESNEISSETEKSNIRVGYIDKKRGYVKNVSIKEAKRVAKDDPGKLFIIENRDGVRYLNINQVVKLKTKHIRPKKGAKDPECSPVEGLKETGGKYSKKNPRIEFFGGGGVGIKANPVMTEDGSQLFAVDLVEGGYGFQYPPFAKFVDDTGFSTQGVLAVDLCGVSTTTIIYRERDQFEDYDIVEEEGSDAIGFGRRYDADGRDIGEWDPTTYKNLGEDPIQNQIDQYMDALNRIQYPWWNSRGFSPLEVIGEDETTRIKYDVQHPTWGAKKDDGYVDIEFEVYGQGSDRNRDIRFRFVEVDDNDELVTDGHKFTIRGITHQERNTKTRKSIKRVKRKTTYKVISESRANSQYKKDLILEQGLLAKSSFGQTGEEKKLLDVQGGDNYAQGSTIFADVVGSANDNDDVQLTCPRGKFTAKNNNKVKRTRGDDEVSRGTFDLYYRLSERVPDPKKIRDSFMNQYAISPVPNSDEEGTDFAGIPYSFIWEENFPFSGDYIFRGSSDGESYLSIDGEKLFEMSEPNDSPKKYKKYIESGVHQIHISLENGQKYEKEVTKVIRKDVEPDANSDSDYKVIYNDLNKNIMIKVSSDAEKVRLLDPDGIEVARLDIDSTKNGRMKFSEDGKKLIVGGKSNKQVDGKITFTWDDSRSINKSKSLGSIKIKDTLWDKLSTKKAIPEFISENFDLYMHGYAGDDLEEHNIQFKFEELNGNHKFVIDAKDYFDTGDNNDGVFSRNNFIEVKPNTNYIVTVSNPGNHETGLVKSFGREPDELNPDSKIGSKITGNIIFRDFTGGSDDNDDFQARFQNGVVTSTRTVETEGRSSFSMVYRYELSKDNNNITGTNSKTISLIDKNYAQKKSGDRESQYEIVKVEKGTKVEGQARNIFDTVKYIDKANRKLWRIAPSAGKKDAFLNSYGIVPFAPKPKLKSKSVEVELVDEIPDIKASFDRDGDDLYLNVIGDGEATINFLMDVDDNLITSGLAASEIRIDTVDQPLTLKRTPGKEKETIRGSAEFVGGKKYQIKIIGGSPTSGFKTIDKTTIGIDDDIIRRINFGRSTTLREVEDFDENIGFKITSINPKPIKVPVEVKIKEPKNDINDAEIYSSSAEEVVVWKHVEFPVTGDYQIDVAAADSVNLYIGNSITDGDRKSGNGLSGVRDGGDEVIINKDGFNSVGKSTGMNSYLRRFERGFYRIRAELIQSSNKSNSKKNPMGLAVKIKIINPQERVVSNASWQENPMGFALTIDAPDPPIPSEVNPQQGGRCQDNPLWTTRFPGAEEQWYPVYDPKNPSRWSKFMNRFALSPFPPLSEENTDNGDDPRSNIWTFKAQETGYYGLKGSADNVGRIIIMEKDDSSKVKAMAQTPNYNQEPGDPFYADLPEDGIGTLYGHREKNPKTHIFKLESGEYKIRVDVENYIGMVKKRIEKVIFNTADWVSEPKKIDFANVNFEKFGQGSNKNMEIKFVFQELGVKNGHTFTIRNVEKSGEIEKFKKKVKINTDYKVTAIATRKINQQPKIKEQKPKTPIEIPVSYNFDNPKNFGFKLSNSGKTISFDDDAVRFTNFGRSTNLREVEDFDENASLKIESTSPGSTAKFSDDGKKIIVSGSTGGDLSIKFEWNDNPSTSGKIFDTIDIGGIIFKQSGERGEETKKIKFGSGENTPDQDPVRFSALEQGVLRKGFGKSGGGKSGGGAKEGGSSPGNVIFADYISSFNDDNDMQIRSESGQFTPSNRRGSIQTSSGDFKGRGTWDLTYRLEVSKTEEVDKITELEGYEGVVYDGPKLATYRTGKLGPFLSPYFKDGVDTITGAAVWTMIWKDVDFPINGRYTLKAQADHILTVKVGGKEIKKIKSDQNVVTVKFTAPKGKNDIELKLKNERKSGVPFKENPVLAAVQISGKIPTDTGSTKSWRQNPVGISAVLIPPPCKKVTSGVGVACTVKVMDPPIINIPPPPELPPELSSGIGTGTGLAGISTGTAPSGIGTNLSGTPIGITSYPVLIQLERIEIPSGGTGIGYTPGDMVVIITTPPPPALGRGGPSFGDGGGSSTGITTVPAEITTSTSGGVISIKLKEKPIGLTSYPKITIVSPQGINFKGIPILKVIRDPIVQDTSKLIQVTDLVGLKQTGYYRGRPYYGSVFYKDKVRYAGWYETPGELVQIYDTLQESIDAQVTTRPSAIIRQGSDIQSNDPKLNIPGTPDNLI